MQSEVDAIAEVVRAEVRQRCVVVRVPMQNLRVDVERTVLGDAVIRLSQKLLERGSSVEAMEEEHINVYQTWWDHFKADVLPLWLRRWLKPPVQLHIPRVRKYVRQCPHVAIPEQTRHLEWLDFDRRNDYEQLADS